MHPQYRQVPAPRRPVPAAPPRAVPYNQWSMPAASPYRPPAGPRQPTLPAGYPPQPGWQHAGWAPRPAAAKNDNTWLIVLLITIVVLIAILLGTAVLYLGARSGTEAGPTTSAAPTSTVDRTTSATRTTATTSTTSPAGTVAGTTPTGTAALQGNPLYASASTGLITQACNADGWPSTSSAGKRFFDSIAPCLDRAWTAAMRSANLSYRSPTVLVPTGDLISSPCGSVNLATENVAAFYCPTNETLYMPPKGLDVDRYGNKPVIYLAVFAHEYGHHVQRVSGIITAQTRIERQYGRMSDRGLESSRRLELQAQCFSGLLVKSVSDTGGQFTRADYPTAYEDQQRGDRPGDPDRTHGTSAHSQAWWDTGYQTNRLARCNTWSASPTDVA
ncbi:Metalloprotease OS=Tsukamurella paurometabola (strain ATCC 8368 / DSM / CCUG 35730 / CIP 100753/ JCM 10117 / KCTC 9821 / NBRC 16120 / NCIMB 702349 / NCTC 13040) OX=521096 GN=Tpau_1467 PE=4 SV=1 [Tsukamurella paurometabola]